MFVNMHAPSSWRHKKLVTSAKRVGKIQSEIGGRGHRARDKKDDRRQDDRREGAETHLSHLFGAAQVQIQYSAKRALHFIKRALFLIKRA